jgi:3-hydroxybutyryl-CoA dehydrogenase
MMRVGQQIQRIAVLGAGIMGHGIAQVCAQAGRSVTLIDSFPQALETARSRMQQSLANLRENGLLAGQADDVLGKVSFTTQLEDAASSADLIFEAIPENAELKRQMFERLDVLCRPDVTFASNTSALPIHLLSTFSRNPTRVIGSHFFNPAQLIPLVEVVTTEHTSSAALNSMMEFLAAAGKKPVHVRKDIPGFIANRLQSALAREAMSLVQKGVAAPEDIDAVFKNSLALRMLFSGPLEQRDLNGLDTHHAVAQTVYPDLEDAKTSPQVLRDKVAKGELGLKTGKGFYDWTSQNRSEVLQRKNQELISVLKFLQTNREG